MSSTALVLCAACDRHVKETESSCPFCGARVVVTRRLAAIDSQSVRDRTTILFGAAAVASAVALAACGNSSSTKDNSVVAPYGVPIPTYPDGGPLQSQPDPTVASTDAGAPVVKPDASATKIDSGPPTSVIVNPYGVPIPTTTAPKPPPPTTAVPAYGAPPPKK